MDQTTAVEIVPVSWEDLESLRAISVQTFTETFAHLNTAADMEKYLLDHLSLQQLKAELEDPGSQFFFARVDGHVAGYLKVNTGRAQTELKNEDALEIERIYVRQLFQGSKVGKALFQKAVELALAAKARYIWLGVWEKNLKAIAFYEKQGFVAFDEHVFVLGNDPQTDIMMKLAL